MHPNLLPRCQLDLLAIVPGAGAVDDEEIAVRVGHSRKCCQTPVR